MNNVHFEEVTAINPEITSKEAIMQVCRRIAEEKGLKALSMRTVAGECGIALGTLYNYFADKEELVIAAIASLWQDFFRLPPEEASPPTLFSEYVERVFGNVRSHFRKYPDFFAAHSAAIAGSGRNRARSAMERCTGEIRDSLLAALRNDSAARPFRGELTRESFVEFVLDSIILLLMQNKPCDTLIAVIRRVIYLEG